MKTMYVSKINLLAAHQHCECQSKPAIFSFTIIHVIDLDPSPLITDA